MTYVVIAAVVVGLFLAFFFKEYYDAKLRERVLLREIGEGFSSFVLKDYSSDELSRIKALCARINDPDTVDDITASDIEFDRLYCYFNHSVSAPGNEYFYYRLRTPIYDKDEVSRLERKVNLILQNEELRKKLQAEFLSIGSMKGVSFWDCLDLFSDVRDKSILSDILPIISMFAGIGLLFVSGPLGVMVLVVILHNLCGLCIGYLIGLALRLPRPKRRAISIEVGMQNSGLASSLANLHFAAYPMAAIPGAIFSVWHNISGGIIARIYARSEQASIKK